ELGLDDMPVLTVFNKADGLTLEDGSPVVTEEDLARLATEYESGVRGEVLYTSAVAGLGIDALRERLMYEFFGTLEDAFDFVLEADDTEEASPAELGIREGDLEEVGEPARFLAG